MAQQVTPRPSKEMVVAENEMLRKQLDEADAYLKEYKKQLRQAIIDKAEEHELACEELDEFLEEQGFEPRGEPFVVWVPVLVRATDEDEAFESIQNLLPASMQQHEEGEITSDPWVDIHNAVAETYSGQDLSTPEGVATRPTYGDERGGLSGGSCRARE